MKKALIIGALGVYVGRVIGNIRMYYYTKKREQHGEEYEEVMKKAKETLDMLDSMNKDIDELSKGFANDLTKLMNEENNPN